MEAELREKLVRTAEAYAAAACCSISTVSRRAKNDSWFFTRMAEGRNSFTARTYDEVMIWFAANWPDDADLPAYLRRYLKASGAEAH